MAARRAPEMVAGLYRERPKLCGGNDPHLCHWYCSLPLGLMAPPRRGSPRGLWRKAGLCLLAPGAPAWDQGLPGHQHQPPGHRAPSSCPLTQDLGGACCYPMVPWATLGLVALNVALFWRPIQPPGGACLSVRTVWDRGQWYRVFLAPFHHLSLCHLLLNMATLFWLGRGMEQQVGALRTGGVLLSLALLGGVLHLALNMALAAATGHSWYREHCAVGFSGVLFSLEAMGRQVEPVSVATLASGVAITTRWFCILECLILAIIHPRSSLTGHISGILAGLAFSAVPEKLLDVS